MTFDGLGSFHIVNLGCKVNRVEADAFASAFISRGATPLPEEAADLVLVNTCTVTGEAEKKARKAVRHALAINPIAQIVVTGCAAAISPETFTSMDPRVTVMPKSILESLLQHDMESPIARIGAGFRTRVGVKVQDGCDHACTYCIVHKARGKARSVPLNCVLNDADAQFRAGAKEVVLAGIDIGAYRDGKTALPLLAETLVELADRTSTRNGLPARLRISSIEPLSVDDALIDSLVRFDGRICRHLHIPLQSGSTKVLREMDRPYTADQYLGLIRKIRAALPMIALSTDIIVGFPGETDDDFEATCDLVREASFMRLHVFPYSKREGTPAAKREDQVPANVKRERASRLRSLGAALAQQDLESRRGTTELCLSQGDFSLTESYHEIPSAKTVEIGGLYPMAL